MPEYPFDLFDTVSECEEALKKPIKDKNEALNKKANIEFQNSKSADANSERNDDLTDAKAEMVKTVDELGAETPDSIEWKKVELRRKELETKIYKLELRQLLTEGIASVGDVYELKKLNSTIAIADEVIAEGNARIKELSK